MKYLHKFNESNKNFIISEKDFEIIENCFLEFIDRGICTHVLGGYSDIEYAEIDFVKFKFALPSIDQSLGYTEQAYIILDWMYKFLTELSGYVKRCESYGFECGVNQKVKGRRYGRMLWQVESELILYVGHKEFIDKFKHKTIYYQRVKPKDLLDIDLCRSLEDALSYTKSELDAWEESWRNR